jgi:hypothetical protein
MTFILLCMLLFFAATARYFLFFAYKFVIVSIHECVIKIFVRDFIFLLATVCVWVCEFVYRWRNILGLFSTECRRALKQMVPFASTFSKDISLNFADFLNFLLTYFFLLWTFGRNEILFYCSNTHFLFSFFWQWEMYRICLSLLFYIIACATLSILCVCALKSKMN